MSTYGGGVVLAEMAEGEVRPLFGGEGRCCSCRRENGELQCPLPHSEGATRLVSFARLVSGPSRLFERLCFSPVLDRMALNTCCVGVYCLRRPQVERIVSGPGISDIACCLGETRGLTETEAKTLAALSPEEIATLAEAQHSQSGDDSGTQLGAIALAAVDTFLSFYGRSLGSAAQTFLAFGGLFIAGGVLPKLAWRWQNSNNGSDSSSAVNPLVAAYLDQGPKMSGIVINVPLLLLDDGESGLKGCLYYFFASAMKKR